MATQCQMLFLDSTRTNEADIHNKKQVAAAVDALSSGRENEFTAELKIKRGSATSTLLYPKDLTEEQIAEDNANGLLKTTPRLNSFLISAADLSIEWSIWSMLAGERGMI